MSLGRTREVSALVPRSRDAALSYEEKPSPRGKVKSFGRPFDMLYDDHSSSKRPSSSSRSPSRRGASRRDGTDSRGLSIKYEMHATIVPQLNPK